MNKYESVVIINPNVDEAGLKALEDKFTGLINANGKVAEVENIGKKSRNEEGLCNFGQYTLNPKHATLLNNKTDKQSILTVREAEILQILAENKGEIVRKEAILSRFWNTEDDYYASRSLDVFITKLRKLFADDPQIEIVTKRGTGYILVINGF